MVQLRLLDGSRAAAGALVAEVLMKHSRMPRKFDVSPDEPKPENTRVTHRNRLTKQSPQDILKRYLTDESTGSIAASLGITRQALSAYLLKHAEEAWKEAQVAKAIARKEKAEEALEVAKDPLALAQARELLKSAQWDLERVCRRIYGQDHNINITVNADLGERLRRARERVIDAKPA